MPTYIYFIRDCFPIAQVLRLIEDSVLFNCEPLISPFLTTSIFPVSWFKQIHRMVFKFICHFSTSASWSTIVFILVCIPRCTYIHAHTQTHMQRHRHPDTYTPTYIVCIILNLNTPLHTIWLTYSIFFVAVRCVRMQKKRSGNWGERMWGEGSWRWKWRKRKPPFRPGDLFPSQKQVSF